MFCPWYEGCDAFLCIPNSLTLDLACPLERGSDLMIAFAPHSTAFVFTPHLPKNKHHNIPNICRNYVSKQV